MGGTLFFLAPPPGSRGCGLWRTDGTPAGTRLVLEVQVPPYGSLIQGLAAFGGRLYFSAYDSRAAAGPLADRRC